MPTTDTGTELSVVELSPNSPYALLPQHLTVPSAITAHTCVYPEAMLTAVDAAADPVMPDTGTETKLSVVELLPN
jgi:hypothetical protein